eukprot:TRINITY_DN2834_c0_g1_i1.p1 TRINITY_DN2834_c0_g1~~TRINITY_DN2834_c0_g1_i1.p1  ORF type:complete len:946 (+),score=308.37 TRINITY_DN2834_c0_g1_i1:367-3204(+)
MENSTPLRVSLTGLKSPDFSVLTTEFLGHGFNILDGRIKFQVFDSLHVDYQPEMSPKATPDILPSKLLHFKNYLEYERELCSRVGILGEDYCEGMFTMAVPLTSSNSVITENFSGSTGRSRSGSRSSSDIGLSFLGGKKKNSLRGLFSSSSEDAGSIANRNTLSQPNLPDHSRLDPLQLASLDIHEERGRSRSSSIETNGTRSRSGSVTGVAFYNQRIIYPFLTGIEKLSDYQHLVQEIEHPLYTLGINGLKGLSLPSPANFSSNNNAPLPPYGAEKHHTSISSRILKEEERVISNFHQTTRTNGGSVSNDFSFRDETKPYYYQLIERIGTHFFTSLTFGTKAEYRWSLMDKQGKDAITKITAQQKYKRRFTSAVQSWFNEELSLNESNGESTEKKVKLPKHCSEAVGLIPSWYTKDPDEKMASARPFAFKLQSLASLFPQNNPGRISRNDMELAVQVYLEEMKPVRDASRLKDSSVVCIFSPDTGSFVELTTHGHLVLKLHINPQTNRAASGANIPAECKFELKKKGNKIGLKSIRWNKKFVSRAMTKSSFHFHRLQFMGPQESFEVCGEYLQSSGTLGNSFLSSSISSSSVEATILHDGSFKKKTRLLILDPNARNSKTEDISEEPMYIEEDEERPVLTSISMSSSVRSSSDEIENGDSIPSNETSLSKSVPSTQDLTPMKVPSGIIHVIPAHLKTTKSNSTSSLFVKDTVLLPNIDQLTKGMAGCIRLMIELGHNKREGELMEIFSEERYPLTRQNFNFTIVPSVETIYHFLNTIFKVEKLPAEPGIMCLIYMRRIIHKSKLILHASNWRRVTLSALILASKVWEDQAVWNVDFIELFPNITVQDLNRLEKINLKILEFNVSIKSSEYVKVYFELREYTDHIDARDPSTRPLGEAGLQQLEIKTASSERAFTMKEVKKTGSLALIDDHHKKKSPNGPRGILS